MISHDLASIQRIADRVAFLHDGKIVFEGTYDELERSALPPIRAFVESAEDCGVSLGDGGEQLSRDALASNQDVLAVELVDVHKQFGGHHVLRGINLAISPRQTTALIGASGSGKSVLIKHIMGLLKPDRGQIRIFGQDIVPMHERALTEMRKQFGLVFQHAALLDWLSVYDNVAFPLVEGGMWSTAAIRERVLEVLERLKIVGIMHRMPGEISEGQKKRVGLARAIARKPAIIIYDEPTTGQDPILTRDIDDMIQETQRQFEVTSIVISHDMASSFRIADMIAMIHDGEIAAYGTPAELRASSNEHVQRFLHC